MPCCTRRRTQLIHEVEEALSVAGELRPFLSAWSVIEERFRGVAEVDESLDPVLQVHSQLKREQTRTALITEELFFNWLCKLPFLSKNFVCTQTGRVWEPLIESFEAFKASSKNVIVSDCVNNTEKTYEFQLWVIKLCNWDGLGVQSNVRLH